MGRRGPKSQPNALKIARGNPHGHTLPEGPAFDAPSSAAPPEGLTGAARDEWIAQVDTLITKGVLTSPDMSMFLLYCQMFGEEQELKEYLSKSKRWTPQKLRLSRYHLQLRTRVAQQAAHFGITPSSRSSVTPVKSSANVADAKRSRFFGVRKEKPA